MRISDWSSDVCSSDLYNPYESGRPSHAGYGAESEFVPDVNGLYQRYRDATGGEVPIVPGVLAGYNDRGVRPRLDHYVIPRAWAPGAAEGTFLAEMLRQVADRWLDPRNPMVMITRDRKSTRLNSSH